MKTKILYAIDVRETDTFPGEPPSVEVVGIANHEHVVDELRDALRWREDAERGLTKLAGGYPEQSLLSVITKLVEEVEHYRQIHNDGELVVGENLTLAVLDRVPSALADPGLWKKVGDVASDGAHAVAIAHPGVEGLVFVTDDAWECHEDARTAS